MIGAFSLVFHIQWTQCQYLEQIEIYLDHQYSEPLSNKNSTLHWRQNSCPGTTLIFFVFSCWAICNVITCSACSLFPVKLVEFLRTLSQEHKNISGGCFCKSTELTCKGNYSESSTDCRVISIAFHHIYCIDQKKDHAYLLAHRQSDTIKKQEC